MADLSPEECKIIKSINSKIKGPGGKVIIVWNIAHKIEAISFESNIIGDSLYNSNPTHSGGELRG
jgi:hypothetical protein